MPPLSHLTSCTPTRSNLYLANSLAAALSEPALYRLLTFHAPNIISLFFFLLRDASARNTPPPEIRMGEYFTSGLFCLQRKHLAREYFRTFFLHREELLAPRPTPKLEDQPLSAVRDCLFNLFAATLHIRGHSSIRNLRTHHAVVTGTHKHGDLLLIL